MTVEEITELAQTEKILLKSELDDKLFALKALKFSILECILYVRVNQNCSLQKARTTVLESDAWKDKKDEFIIHQQQQTEEFLEAAKNEINEIRQTFSDTENEITVSFNSRKQL
ncbi:hypothetical protein SD427_07995 [Chryseobacterium sp. JJR-5R]|uniref:hypothetical protein n=1 Tax=Chryseobacterium sp. JJR-5R TaxID=3093923 RepID=UPI002A75BC9F|nr:hypothetical protein [Chryseobacterium sp. JJR-5R]WPO84265.1 hypothetical protein SD427_07995 [Chryseobacterium sp. JJR-5R]